MIHSNTVLSEPYKLSVWGPANFTSRMKKGKAYAFPALNVKVTNRNY
jgi:hypothetical protein